mmetsp:Transcript_98869/g.121048  ORF Transcript_98869/g.121048 Transcript_98869/m.121048 type:complete len:192 (-) Transcript_98869:158-733(-)
MTDADPTNNIEMTNDTNNDTNNENKNNDPNINVNNNETNNTNINTNDNEIKTDNVVTDPIKKVQTKARIDIQAIGTTFVKQFYTKMSKNRKDLEPLYKDPSCLSYEGQGYQGCKNIMNKLINLPIKSIKHDPKTVDVQPSGCGGLMIFVTGDLRLDDMQNPVKFSESFHIVPNNGSTNDFWVHNDIFRLQV